MACPIAPIPVHHVKIFSLELFKHLIRDLLGNLGPDVHNFVVPFTIGDKPFTVLILDIDDSPTCLFN